MDRKAGKEEIKKAYRKIALQHHPDRTAGNKESEAIFKEASEAYSVLSDPDKKAKYDQFGFSGVDGQPGPDFSGGFGNLNDILNDLFGGAFGGFGAPGATNGTANRIVGQPQPCGTDLFGHDHALCADQNPG